MKAYFSPPMAYALTQKKHQQQHAVTYRKDSEVPSGKTEGNRTERMGPLPAIAAC
jgi:hypothetical protein